MSVAPAPPPLAQDMVSPRRFASAEADRIEGHTGWCELIALDDELNAGTVRSVTAVVGIQESRSSHLAGVLSLQNDRW